MLNEDLEITFVDSAATATIDVSTTDYGAKPEITNGKLIFPELDGAAIRSDGERFSVFDFVRVVGKQRNPRKAWERLIERHPELVAKCYKYKFPGTTGGAARKTPATDRQGLIEIIQVLPGAVGAKFRREAAKIILRYLDADVTLADEVVDGAIAKGNVDEVERLIHRTQGKIARKQLTGIAAAHGLKGSEGYRRLTSLIYKALTGKTASQLRKELGLDRNQIIRDHFGSEWLIALGFLEMAVAKALEAQNANGNKEVLAIAQNISLKVMQFV